MKVYCICHYDYDYNDCLKIYDDKEYAVKILKRLFRFCNSNILKTNLYKNGFIGPAIWKDDLTFSTEYFGDYSVKSLEVKEIKHKIRKLSLESENKLIDSISEKIYEALKNMESK